MEREKGENVLDGTAINGTLWVISLATCQSDEPAPTKQ